VSESIYRITAVSDVPPRVKRLLPWGLGAVVTLLVGSTALCCFAGAAITARYDGITSVLNPLAATSCCAGITLGALALLVWQLLSRSAERDREHDGD
jgi:hypothetical protein